MSATTDIPSLHIFFNEGWASSRQANNLEFIYSKFFFILNKTQTLIFTDMGDLPINLSPEESPFPLTEVDKWVLSLTDEEFHYHDWEDLKKIIGMVGYDR